MWTWEPSLVRASRASYPRVPGVMGLEQFGEPVAKVESRPSLGRAGLDEVPRTLFRLHGVEHEPHPGGVTRIVHVRRQTAEATGQPHADRHLEHLLGELHRPRQERG